MLEHNGALGAKEPAGGGDVDQWGSYTQNSNFGQKVSRGIEAWSPEQQYLGYSYSLR